MLVGLFRQRLAARYWELTMFSHDLFADGSFPLELFVKLGLVLDEALESGLCAVDLGCQPSSTFLQLLDRCIGCRDLGARGIPLLRCGQRSGLWRRRCLVGGGAPGDAPLGTADSRSYKALCRDVERHPLLKQMLARYARQHEGPTEEVLLAERMAGAGEQGKKMEIIRNRTYVENLNRTLKVEEYKEQQRSTRETWREEKC